MRALIGLAIALTLVSSALAVPLRIVTGGSAAPLERRAAAELQSYLPRLTEQPVRPGDGDGLQVLVGTRDSLPALRSLRPALPDALVEQEIIVRSGQAGGQPALAVTGGSPAAVQWAAYALLEHLGVVFEFSGEVLPPRQRELDLSSLNMRQHPRIAERGLRLHLNFPMDQSAYSLPEFRAWADRMARLKFNYLMFHFYSAHPWFVFRYRNAETTHGTFFVGSYLFGGKYELPPDMIGRNQIRNQRTFFPPELEGMAQSDALYRQTEERMRAVFDHCHARGLKVAVSFEPLSPPGDIAAHLAEWEQQAGGHDRLMRHLTAARLQACMDAYPQADEYQLISVEGSDDAPAGLDLKADLKRLCDKYHIPFDPQDEAQFAGAREAGINLSPYNAPVVADELNRGLYRPVVSTLRFVDLALDVLKDPDISARLQRERKLGNVGIYLPHAQAVKLCLPALRVMMPPQSRLQLMCDYGARGTADQMKTWDALRGANLQLGVITWLEFDGSMFLPEAWPTSVNDCIANAEGLPLTTLVANHWRVSGLEADAAALSENTWSDRAPSADWLAHYGARLYGAKNAEPARAAYAALEDATLYCRAHLFNVGFCYEGRWRSGFGYPAEDLQGAKQRFAAAEQAFTALAATQPPGRARERAEVLANRCRCAQLHLATVAALGEAEVGADASADRLAAAGAACERARDLAEQYMRTYAQFVLDRGDEGMLVNYHFAVVQQARTMAQAARQLSVIANADPRLPLMSWGFDEGDAAAVPDASGHGFVATCEGKVDFAPGKVGRALKLDGHSDLRVDNAAAFNPASLTVSVWIMPERTNARRGIVVKRVGNVAAPFVFGLHDGALRFEGCGNSPAFWPFNFSGPAVPAGQWSHVAVTLEGGRRIALYLNGQQVADKAITEVPAPNGEPIVIGREAWGGEEGQAEPAYFRGLMDEVKIWKRALSADEVKDLARP